jgi:hypothetical protein
MRAFRIPFLGKEPGHCTFPRLRAKFGKVQELPVTLANLRGILAFPNERFSAFLMFMGGWPAVGPLGKKSFRS